MNNNTTLLNEQINLHLIRLVSDDGEQDGIMTSSAAYTIAQSKGLDLVLISPEAIPPVCKVLNWGKHLFDLKKRQKESKSKQTVVDTKEVQLRPTTDVHDLETKMNKAKKFLEKGKHVRFHMRFRGREASHAEIGMEMMNGILETLGDTVVIDKKPILKGKNIIMLVAPATK